MSGPRIYGVRTYDDWKLSTPPEYDELGPEHDCEAEEEERMMEEPIASVHGTAEEVVLTMLDWEANKNLQEDVRAGAMFFRLIMPSFEEALDAVAKRHGIKMSMMCLGSWLGSLASGTILEQIPTAPHDFKEAITKDIINSFAQSCCGTLEKMKAVNEGGKS